MLFLSVSASSSTLRFCQWVSGSVRVFLSVSATFLAVRGCHWCLTAGWLLVEQDCPKQVSVSCSPWCPGTLSWGFLSGFSPQLVEHRFWPGLRTLFILPPWQTVLSFLSFLSFFLSFPPASSCLHLCPGDNGVCYSSPSSLTCKF